MKITKALSPAFFLILCSTSLFSQEQLLDKVEYIDGSKSSYTVTYSYDQNNKLDTVFY